MAIYTGKVVDGQVVVQGAILIHGTTVTILVPDDAEPFYLSPDMEAELEESIAQLDRGEAVSAEQVLEGLHARTRIRS